MLTVCFQQAITLYKHGNGGLFNFVVYTRLFLKCNIPYLSEDHKYGGPGLQSKSTSLYCHGLYLENYWPFFVLLESDVVEYEYNHFYVSFFISLEGDSTMAVVSIFCRSDTCDVRHR